MTNESIVRNKQGRMVGRIQDRVFVKEVYGNRHMLRKPVAWAIDCAIFDNIIYPKGLSIHIVDRDTGRKYVCGAKTFQENKQRIKRGHGEQYYLGLIYWRII